jgi:hypothetical protein
VKVLALHVDVTEIRMILMMNAADDVSCYGPNDAQNQFSQRIFRISSHAIHLSCGSVLMLN